MLVLPNRSIRSRVFLENVRKLKKKLKKSLLKNASIKDILSVVIKFSALKFIGTMVEYKRQTFFSVYPLVVLNFKT